MEVLWIEDNDDIYIAHRLNMEKENFHITVVAHKANFELNYMKNLDKYDVIILDLLFDNDEDETEYLGFKIYEMIREQNKNIPIIIWSIVLDQVKQYTEDISNKDPHTQIIARHEFDKLLKSLKEFREKIKQR